MSGRDAVQIQGDAGRQYHIGFAPGEVAPFVILVGDPARARRVAERFTSRRLERSHREYVGITGAIDGLDLTVLATGMGPDNTEIAIVELLRCVERPTLLRIGTSGALQPELDLGSLVVSTGAVRLECTTSGYLEPGYPAIAHHELVLALRCAGLKAKVPLAIGVTATAPGFYGWQGRETVGLKPRDPGLLDRLQEQGVLNFEMEASTLFALSSALGLRAGAVCAVFANRPKNQFIAEADQKAAEDTAIAVGLRALQALAEWDRFGLLSRLQGEG